MMKYVNISKPESITNSALVLNSGLVFQSKQYVRD